MVAEPVVGVVVGIAVELVGCSVEVVAATLGVDENHNARATTVFGIEVPGEGFEFAHSVQTQRGVFAVVRANVCVDDAIEEEIVRRTAHSVDVEIIGLVEHQPELRIVVRNHSRQRCEQRFKISPIQRLLGYLPLVDHRGVA